MADHARTQPGPFDVRTIEQLVALMSQHDLSEMDLREGEQRICLRRGGGMTTVEPRFSPVERPIPTTNPAPKAAETPPPLPTRQLLEIKSPAVGTFYAQEKPGSAPYVAVGARVTPTTVVCQIEAMKIFNEITADCSGVIREVLVKDKEFVEFGTVLFRVDPNA
ncbi:MAG TPA: biotin/lipoyl-containing protein [Gemmataceae bacterium]|nr:biotin/lipoyl-containing protein [Gemmataceae bacterium]